MFKTKRKYSQLVKPKFVFTGMKNGTEVLEIETAMNDTLGSWDHSCKHYNQELSYCYSFVILPTVLLGHSIFLFKRNSNICKPINFRKTLGRDALWITPGS